jgi:fermentation-respiration switch protein FrsA (DUF1100 family)
MHPWGSRLMTATVSGLALLTGVVVLVVIVFWVGQRRLMYFPTSLVPSPASVGLSDAEPVAFTGADNVTLHGWFLPSGRAAPTRTVLVFNGNAGNRAYRADLGAAFRSRGLSVLLFDYRGYGENAGTPTETGLADDARAALSYLLSRRDVNPDRVVYFGESLGSAVATRLAAEHAPAALVLRSPFTSFVDLGRIHYPLLPVRWLLRDRFPSIDVIPSVRSPILIIAGSRDSLVPIEQSRHLYDAATSTKSLFIVEGADHNDEALVAGAGMIDATVRFLEKIG